MSLGRDSINAFQYFIWRAPGESGDSNHGRSAPCLSGSSPRRTHPIKLRCPQGGIVCLRHADVAHLARSEMAYVTISCGGHCVVAPIGNHVPFCAVNRDPIPFLDFRFPHTEKSFFFLWFYFCAPDHRRFSHLSSHDSSMRSHPAGCSQDTLRSAHSMNVVGRCLFSAWVCPLIGTFTSSLVTSAAPIPPASGVRETKPTCPIFSNWTSNCNGYCPVPREY